MLKEGEQPTTTFGRRLFIEGALAALATACSEVTPQSPITPEVNSGNLDIFFIGPDVPMEMHGGIIDAVRGTRQWFLSRNIPISKGVSVYAFNNPHSTIDQYLQRTPFSPAQKEEERKKLLNATAWVGFFRDIYIITSSGGWMHASPIIGGPVPEGRVHTVAHELFHIVQREIGAYHYPPTVAWMNEGSAHYIAAVMLADRKIYDYLKIRNGHVGEALKVKEPLAQLETDQFYQAGDRNTADEYSLAFLAVEYLVRHSPNLGIDAIVNFWRGIGQGIQFPLAFNQAFGKTTQDFYQEFEAYRQQRFTFSNPII